MLVHQQWGLHASRVETNRTLGMLATITQDRNCKHVHQKMRVGKSYLQLPGLMVIVVKLMAKCMTKGMAKCLNIVNDTGLKSEIVF